MYWLFVVVHILIIGIISHESFPIDLKEIEHEDIYLVDKERKGRFIEVNQTTFLPNMNAIELIREKKSSIQNEKVELENIVTKNCNNNYLLLQKSTDKNDVSSKDVVIRNEEKKSAADELIHQKINDVSALNMQDNYTCADSIFEPQTFGFPSFFEDHLLGDGRQPYFSSSMLPTFTDNCQFDKFVDFSCMDELIYPEGNAVC